MIGPSDVQETLNAVPAPPTTGRARKSLTDATATQHGALTHQCGATWTGLSRAHCSGCHRTFASVGLFDAHRSLAGDHGACRDPATLTYQTGPRAGERIMFYRDGMWRAPEMTDEEKEAAFGNRLPQ